MCESGVFGAAQRCIAPSGVNSIGDPITTDSAIAVVQLQGLPCGRSASSPPFPEPAPFKPGNAVFRYLRRDVLTVRSDMLAGQHHLRHLRCAAHGLSRLEAPRTGYGGGWRLSAKPAQATVESPNRRTRDRSALEALELSSSPDHCVLSFLRPVDPAQRTRYSQGTPHHIAFPLASKPYNAKEG